MTRTCPAFCHEPASTLDQLSNLVFITWAIGSELPQEVCIEFGFAGEGGLVDPLSGDGFGNDVESGLIVLYHYVGVVGLSSSGHGRVHAATVCRTVDEEEGEIDGAALARVARLRVAELHMLGRVGAGDPDRAGQAGEGDAAVVVDSGEGPVVAVLDHESEVGVETPVVAAGDHLVSDQHSMLTDLQAGSGRV